MKHIFLYLSMLFCSNAIWAQGDTRQLLAENKKWEMHYTINNPPNSRVARVEEMTLTQDTTINGLSFKRRETKSYILGEDIPSGWVANGYLGYDHGKVYVWKIGYSHPQLCMDFSLEVGDELTLGESGSSDFTYKVIAVSDTIFNNSADKERRKCIYVRGLEYSNVTDVWVEGIGSLTYGVTGVTPLFFGASPCLYECAKDGVILFRSNETSFISSVQLDVLKTNAIFDLQGRRLTQAPAKGVFIQNGKKVIY